MLQHGVQGGSGTMLVASREDDARDRHAPDEADIHGKPFKRIGGLDGLRAVAVMAVVAYHLWPDQLRAGFLGVDLFMVLSGFLITGLLVEEGGGRRSRLRSEEH